MTTDEHTDPLCCCEYFNLNNERYHILECCCNCIDFDEAFDRFVCCNPISGRRKTRMLLIFQDRLRIPWRGGAKQIALDAIIPIFAVPFIIGISAINELCMLLMIATTFTTLFYFYWRVERLFPKTKLFLVWIIMSIIWSFFIFEYTVPLLEILPEENCILIAMICISLFCLYKTRRKAKESFVDQVLLPDGAETAILMDHEDGPAEVPNLLFPPPTADYYEGNWFCPVCHAIVAKHDHHSYLLACCIGKANHRYYIFGILFGLLAIVIAANLALTSVCHPLLIIKALGIHVLLPDDCSEVFDQYEMALPFVLSIYGLILSVILLIEVIFELYLVSAGLTISSWRMGKRPNGKSVWWNYKTFFF